MLIVLKQMHLFSSLQKKKKKKWSWEFFKINLLSLFAFDKAV